MDKSRVVLAMQGGEALVLGYDCRTREQHFWPGQRHLAPRRYQSPNMEVE
jgi:hypothetical protein